MKKALCLVLAVVITMMCSSALAELPTWKILKDFKVKTMDGETFELYKTLEEKELAASLQGSGQNGEKSQSREGSL